MSSWTFSTQGHYALEVAREMDAEIQIVSQSGWGVYAAWNNDRTCILPRIYDQVCSVVTGEVNVQHGSCRPFDETQFEPDAVVINLGTNDANAFHEKAWIDPDGRKHRLMLDAQGGHTGADAENIVLSVAAFLRQIRIRRPAAYLLWAYGMCGNEIEELIQRGVMTYRTQTGDERVGYLALEPMHPGEEGPHAHPGPISHRRTGRQIIQALSQVLA